MGNVATLFKVYVENGREDEVSKKIKEELKPKSMQLEEIAFGIKVVKVLFVHEDTLGSAELEEKLKAISGVSEAEVAEESLL